MPREQSVEELIAKMQSKPQPNPQDMAEAQSKEEFYAEANKYDASNIRISRQNVLDTIFLYRNYKKTDDAFMTMLGKVEKLAASDRKTGSGSIDQRKLFTSLKKNLDKYLSLLDAETELIEKEAAQKLRIKKNGELVWALEDDFVRNQVLFGIEMDLNKKRSSNFEKRAICNMLKLYLAEQAEGGLDPAEAAADNAVRINAVGQPLYLIDQQLPCIVMPEDSSDDLLTETEYPLFPGQPHGNDIIQRGNLDRYFLSVLSIIAEDFSEDIRECMHDNHDGTVTVRLYNKDENGKFTPAYITIDKLVQSPSGIIIDGPTGCLWASCIERAAAAKDKPSDGKPWPSVDGIIKADAASIFEMIMGRQFSGREIEIPQLAQGEMIDIMMGAPYSKSLTDMYDSVNEALESGIVVAYSKIESYIIQEAHAYTVTGTMTDGSGRSFLCLRNPWGYLDGDVNKYNGLITTFDADGRRSCNWTGVPAGDFNVELVDFVREFDYLAVTGAKRKADSAAANIIRKYLESMDKPVQAIDPDTAQPDEALDFKIISSYVKAVDDMNQIFESSRRYHGAEPDAYTQLLNKMKIVKTELLILRGKPFEDLRSKMFELIDYLDAYDRHCERLQIINWRRKLRVAACAMLRDSIRAAGLYSKHPNMPIYMAYAAVYAEKLAKQQGYTMNEAARQLAAKKILEDPKYFNKIKHLNLFYIKYGLDKEFMTELNTFK